MSHEILIKTEGDEQQIYAAFIENNRLVDLVKSARGQTDRRVGRIYLARILRIVPHLQAAFVDIGEDMDGFLGAREAHVLNPDATKDTPIEACIDAGDEILVQVTRAPWQNKGPQLTADITIPGRAIVAAPCRQKIMVSRAIEDEAERERLQKIVENACMGTYGEAIELDGINEMAGWIIRTAAQGLTAQEIAEDMRMIAAKWQALIKRTDHTAPPLLVHEDLTALSRILRDYVSADTSRIIIEGTHLFAEAQAYCKTVMPHSVPLLHPSDAGENLFERYDIASQIAHAEQPRIDLPSGGWLMIETTTAMTTIDVNSGSHNDDAYAVNREAIDEIARQIRVRALGGLIAIDFIDMPDAQKNADIQAHLSACFAHDKVPTRIGAMSEFGVIEMTRRRR